MKFRHEYIITWLFKSRSKGQFKSHPQCTLFALYLICQSEFLTFGILYIDLLVNYIFFIYLFRMWLKLNGLYLEQFNEWMWFSIAVGKSIACSWKYITIDCTNKYERERVCVCKILRTSLIQDKDSKPWHETSNVIVIENLTSNNVQLISFYGCHQIFAGISLFVACLLCFIENVVSCCICFISTHYDMVEETRKRPSICHQIWCVGQKEIYFV